MFAFIKSGDLIGYLFDFHLVDGGIDTFFKDTFNCINMITFYDFNNITIIPFIDYISLLNILVCDIWM